MGQCTNVDPWLVLKGLRDDGPCFDDIGGTEIRNDQTNKTMSDPDWLEIVGHPTIPNTQSLRAPPAQVALHGSKERLTAVTNKHVSKRYVQKLQKDRERNKEVLAECRDNLPIVIKPMVYPEKPTAWNQKPWHLGTSTSLPSREKKFRISKQNGDDFWHESQEVWTKSDTETSEVNPQKVFRTAESEKGPSTSGAHSSKKTWSHCSSTSEPIVLSSDYVASPGFQGANGLQSTNFKYKFYKKPTHISTETASSQVQSTFKPKGYGSLYDEMEFDRRYKKVFDLNKHIHFVHSNLLSGQRIVKRTKLPPIGHVPNLPANSEKGGDIFAIMSVQKYNHPEDGVGSPRAPDVSPRSKKSPTHRKKRFTEVPKSEDLASGFVPSTAPSTQFPSEDIRGLDEEKVSREPIFRLPVLKPEADSALGTLTEENTVCDAMSKNSLDTSRVSKTNLTHQLHDLDVPSVNKKNIVDAKSRLSQREDETMSRDARSEFGEEPAPFNISVHVNIKPKGGDDDGILERENSRHSEHIDGGGQTPTQDAQSVVYKTSAINTVSRHEVNNVHKQRGNGGALVRQKQFGLVTQTAKPPNKRVPDTTSLEEGYTDPDYSSYTEHKVNDNGENFTSTGVPERANLSTSGHHVIC